MKTWYVWLRLMGYAPGTLAAALALAFLRMAVQFAPALLIQRMFDAYALLQAQERLHISDEQFPPFLGRFKALQEARRRSLVERSRIVMDLRRLLDAGAAGAGEDAALKERLTALQDVEGRSSAEIRTAYEAVDQVLDLRQRAQFRVFEELMERRKLDLVTRARQGNRPRQQP